MVSLSVWKISALLLAITLASASGVGAVTETDALKHAADRGRLLYAYDQAAWVTTDEMFKVLRDPHAAGVAGYIVEPASDGVVHVIYYRLDGLVPHAVFTAEVRGRSITASRALKAGDDDNLSSLANRLIKARAAAIAEAAKQRMGRCANAPFNTVALPPETPEGPIPVYLLTPQTEDNLFPFGGHYEFDIAPNGYVAASRPFTKSCIKLPKRDIATNAEPAGVLITHLLDPTPTEIHVYLSLWMEEPVYVSTGEKRLWRVERGNIEPVNIAGR